MGKLSTEYRRPLRLTRCSGAFNYGSNAVARFLPSNLSSFARSIGKPVVLVQINYRVGPFGFAVSKDFATEADLDDKRECLGNFGFIDQRNALQWVQDHIHEFGGDPENVTAAGNSAGSTSIHYHILSGTRFFDRAIMMSGTAGCLGPMSFELHEKEWLKAATLCGISQLPPAIRFHTMRSLSPELLIQVYTAKAMGPYGDGKLLPLSWTYGDHTAPSRCKSIVLGDTRNEGIIFDIFTKLVPQYGFLAFLMEVLPDAKIREGFCSTFGFTTSDYTLGTLPEEVYRDALRLFFTVSAFQYPTLRVAETFSSSGDPARQAYLYHFDDYSPFEGITFGHSYHGQCGLYLYQNQKGTKEFSDSAAAIGENMAQAWLGFAYGLEPWIAYQPEQGEDKFMRFGPEGESSLKSMAEDNVRDYGLLPWVREHWIDVQRFARRLLLES